jgi:hypothetical protein
MAIALPALAQFGHPLKGSWSGEWRESLSKTHRILLEINWQGKYGVNPEGGVLTGTLNPGTDSAPLRNIRVVYPKGGVQNADAPWEVHFETEIKDEQGNVSRIIVDGFLENLGAYRRILHGTWQQGSRKGPFRIESNYGL